MAQFEPYSRLLRLVALLAATAICSTPVFADDSAYAIGAGGLQPIREARVSMEKERLTISLKTVTVEFEFLNDTENDITTEVGFPVPPYTSDFPTGPFGFDDFRVWVDGVQKQYEIEARAIRKGVDYTELLRKLGVDVASFGHFTDEGSPELDRLSDQQRAQLSRLGLMRKDNFTGWTAVKKYHWTQTFPAHKIVRIRHTYSPITGYGLLRPELTPRQRRKDYPESEDFKEAVRTSCADALHTRLTEDARKQEGAYVVWKWVDYILTSANSWKTPIKDFELIVEPPPEEADGRWLTSFCWNNPVTALDANSFAAKAANFVPRRELHIAFFEVH